jgi:adenylate cyclase class 2
MRYEVEQKHRVDDVGTFLGQLADRGIEIGGPVEQVDEYFAHPCRDFASTDEALRIRLVGGRSFVTYKGPKIDTTTKTRHELEFPLAEDDSDGSRFDQLLRVLGFTPVARVRKRRQRFEIDADDQQVEGALDEVEGVGSFVELELQSDTARLEPAKRTIAKLASELSLGPTERRSYLEMLLEKRRLAPGN